MRHFTLNFRFYVKNINDLSCNYFGAIEVKQYCVLRKAKKIHVITVSIVQIYS